MKAYVKYRYNYGGTVKMILNYLLEFFTNLIFTVLVLIAVVALIANIHPPQIVQRIVGSVLMIAWSALAALHIVLAVMPKSISMCIPN